MENIIKELSKKEELIPDEHDGSYELVKETVRALSTIDEENLRIEDLNLLYFSTVGTFSRTFPNKITCINRSNLSDQEKERLKKLLKEIREKANNGAYDNHGQSDTIGMFGTGIGTLRVNKEGIKRFIKLCTEIVDMDDENAILDLAEEELKYDIKGLGIASVSQTLHCIKPYVFPILNEGGNSGIPVFKKMGVNLVKPKDITHYIENTRIIKKFRDENFKFKNYRIIDMFFWDYVPIDNCNYWLLNVYFKNGTKVWDYCKDNNCFAMQYEYGIQDNASVTRNLEIAKQVKVGDYCIAYTGQKSIVGIGKVTREFYEENEKEQFIFHDEPWAQRIGVNWELVCHTPVGITNFVKTFDIENQVDLSSYAINKTTKKGYEYAENILNTEIDREKDGGRIISKVVYGNEPYSKDKFLEEVFVNDEKYNEIIYSLKAKKNIILQGPPGVGKTFVAKRIAYAKMGSKDNDKIEMVQFHQSYSYEDFIQGFRPTQDGTFELKNGIFYNFCMKAKDNPSNDYFFIIDEINRGNLSKIFGELMMLIESDKRGEEFEIALTYSENEKFYIPENIYIIGTMNTADRSLAMVDYALRRRFRFINIEPAFNSEKFISHLKKNNIDEHIIEKVINRMNRLNSKIKDDTRDLGKGYEIGHSYFCTKPLVEENSDDWYKRIVYLEIKPLLYEYWFDNEETAKIEVESLL